MIFITENDVLKRGLPIYHIDRMIKETGELFTICTRNCRLGRKNSGAERIEYQMESTGVAPINCEESPAVSAGLWCVMTYRRLYTIRRRRGGPGGC